MNKTAQDLAKSIAKQIADEPVEIIKDAGEQIVGERVFPEPAESQTPTVDTAQQENRKAQDDAFAARRTRALQNEIEDIRKQNLFKELQSKISEGLEIPLEDYPLSLEQKQVLKAQMEAVKIQKQNMAYQAGVSEVPSVHSKPGRRFGAGQKHEAEKQQTRVEKPVPPSG